MRVLIVGSGIAGLTAALHAHEAGHSVTLIVKEKLGGGSTHYAQGGIAGVYGPDDSAAQHAKDTLAAGAGLSEQGAVEVLVADGAARITELIHRGVAFDRSANGELSLGMEAAHTHARIVHAGGDATGAAISAALCEAVKATSITIREDTFLCDFTVDAGTVVGAQVLIEGRLEQIPADRVILATGGAGQLYLHTTNPPSSTGDGIAAAIRAGALVADLEFVQFHPTILASGSAFLVSEAVRGEGATLVGKDGERFMFDIHPDGELAPRDVVARGIAQHAAKQQEPVRLDATMLGAERLARRFPTIDRVTRERGFDWSLEPIPVTPAAHYLMGGVVTDIDGHTSIPGLLAAGEVARTGVHGANRLASNSLLEAAVFGARAVMSMHHTVPAIDRHTPQQASMMGASRTELQELMWNNVGLLRHPSDMQQAHDTLASWRLEGVAPSTITEYEDANLLLVAQHVTAAALARRESVGAHALDTATIGA